MKKIIKTLFSGGQQVAAAALLALLFSATTIFISPIYLNTSLDWHLWLPNGWLMASAQALLWALPLFLLLLVALTYGGVFLRWLARFNPLKKLSFSWSKRSVLITAAILLIFWLPWIIIYYPGSTPYDPVAQIYQIHGSGAFRPEIWEPTVDGWISNSHPILHTLILGGFFELGNALGSQNLGIFMYSLFQTLVRAITFAVVCCYLMRLRTPKVFCLLTLAFFALFPAIASSSMVTFKDHLFSPVSVIYALLVIEIVRTRGAVLKSKRFVGALATASLLMPLLKHPGIYIVVASGICLLVIYRRYWKQFLISLSLPIGFVYIIFPYLLFPMLHVVPAGSQDVFGPMLSQTARVLRDHPDALNSEERETLHKVVPYRVMATGYSTASTDYVKGNFRQDSSLSERLDYLALWARQGFRYPIEYFEAFFTIQSAWFSPDRGWDIFDNLYPGTAQHVVDLVGHNNRLPFNKAKQVRQQLYFDGPVQLYPAKQFMRYTFHHLHEAPVVGILFAKPLYTFYLPFIVFAVVLINKRRFLPAFIPAIFSFGVLLISPMDMSRYALPLLEATPLFLGLAILSLMYPQKYLQNSKHPKRYDRIVAEDTEPAIPEDGHA